MAVITNENGQIQTQTQRVQTVQDVLQNEGVRTALSEVLPNHIEPQRFARIAMTSLRRNPKLLQCNPTSFLSALLQSATLGLEPDTALGHSYLIPYGQECTLVVGYEGYIDLAYRSGVVTSIHANVVRDDDEFDWGEGSSPFIKHKPKAVPQSYRQGNQTYLSGRDVSHAYAVAQLLGGGHVQVVMMKAEIDAIKSRSRASHDGPWVTDPVAMMKKTAIRQLRKFLPMSPQARALHMAAGLDEQADAGLAQAFDVPVALFEDALSAGPKLEDEPIVIDTDEDAPTEYGRCPIHGDAWTMNGKGFFHRADGAFCSPSKVALALAEQSHTDEATLNEWLKATFGFTRSRLEPDHLPAIVTWLQLEPQSQPAQATMMVPEDEEWPE